MGTNYYVHVPPCAEACKHCGREQQIHLGKSSGGWRFVHRAYRDYQPDAVDWPVTDRASWLRLLDLGPVYDEYGQLHSADEFLELIESKQGGIANDSMEARELCGPHYRPLPSDFVADGYDFCDEEFS